MEYTHPPTRDGIIEEAVKIKLAFNRGRFPDWLTQTDKDHVTVDILSNLIDRYAAAQSGDFDKIRRDLVITIFRAIDGK